jgi:hypothetical protein
MEIPCPEGKRPAEGRRRETANALAQQEEHTIFNRRDRLARRSVDRS